MLTNYLKKATKSETILGRMLKRIDLSYRTLLTSISPALATRILYRRAFGKQLDLDNPITLNEKILWLKLNTYYKNQLVTICADKYKVREYITACGCEEILNELISVWDSVEEIDWNSLPEKFVIKCNHGCGYNILCDNKSNLDVENAKKKLKKWMSEDQWKFYAEINYKYIERKIICEKYIETADGSLPMDYKVYCFNGVPECVMVCAGREKGHPKYYYYDSKWNMLPYSKDALEAPEGFSIPKPLGIDKLFDYARVLSKPFPFVRADFYLEEERVIFGELTFTPGGGLDARRLPNTDVIFGNLVILPKHIDSQAKL